MKGMNFCMCGIAGWINIKDNITYEKEIIHRMTDKLLPRGPDATGYWYSTHALLGHQRLAIIDPSGGVQPMVEHKGDNTYVIIYNGELYNTEELRNELKSKGYLFRTTSDTEVLLKSFVEWGPGCSEKINGIYAFAVWDEKERSLFLCRDRFGVKPLFYAVRKDTFIFASELKSILAHPMVEPEVDNEGLAEVFALGPARTPGHGVFKNVYELKPAHYLTYNSAGIQTKRYWALESYPHTDSIEKTIDTLKELVVDSIERQLVSDVPVCTFLSGGLDSSAITAVSSNHFRHNMGIQLHTYSIDYIDNELYFKASNFQPNSDAPWVKLMSEKFNTFHHFVKFDTPQLVEALEYAVEARDLPGMADIDSSLWLFCREVRKNAKVALSGECADEIFGGYPWFHREEMLYSNTFPWSRDIETRLCILSGDLKEIIQAEKYIARRYEETLDEVPYLPGEKGLEKRRREMFYLNITWFMSNLLDRKDRMSMASGLEVRVPFCDHRLVQYVWNIPWEIKMYGGREKGILREALKGILPNEIIYRKKSPYPKTHNPSYEAMIVKKVLEIVNDSNSPIQPLIDKNVILNLVESKSDYGKPWFGQLMAKPQLLAYLVQVDIWLRKYNIRLV